MNVWLTIVGFFGVLLGLAVPLASYLLQQRSLSDEREQIKGEMESRTKDAAKDAAEKAANSVKDELQKQIDVIREELRKVDGIRDEIEEMRGMIEADREAITQAKQMALQATEKAEIVKSEVTKLNQMQQFSKAVSKDEKAAEEFSKDGDEKKSAKPDLDVIRKMAEQGDAKSQYRLGRMYQCAKGVEKDEFETIYWYRKAAEQKNAWGRLCMSVVYESGTLGEKQDLKKARELCQQVIDDPTANEKAKEFARKGIDRIDKKSDDGSSDTPPRGVAPR